MVTDGGFEVAFHGEYRELTPNERIVCTTLITRMQHKSQEHRDAHINSGMEAGMQNAMDLLEQVAMALGAGA